MRGEKSQRHFKCPKSGFNMNHIPLRPNCYKIKSSLSDTPGMSALEWEGAIQVHHQFYLLTQPVFMLQQILCAVIHHKSNSVKWVEPWLRNTDRDAFAHVWRHAVKGVNNFVTTIKCEGIVSRILYLHDVICWRSPTQEVEYWAMTVKKNIKISFKMSK